MQLALLYVKHLKLKEYENKRNQRKRMGYYYGSNGKLHLRKKTKQIKCRRTNYTLQKNKRMESHKRLTKVGDELPYSTK